MSDVVDEPLPTDIICGRGNLHHHPGNITFRIVTLENTGEYKKTTSQAEKSAIILRIYESLHRKNMRFVERDVSCNEWTIVRNSERIIEKIRQRVSNPKQSAPNHGPKKHKKQEEDTQTEPYQMQNTALSFVPIVPDHDQSGCQVQGFQMSDNVDPFNRMIFCQGCPSVAVMEESKKRLIANIKKEILQLNPGLN